jgi:thioredoxin-related protein
MSKVYQKVELTANVLIIAVAILLIGVVIQGYFFAANPSAPNLKTPTIGNKLSVPEVDFSKKDKNVLLVLSKGCKFCSESAEFYKKLIAENKGKDVNFVAVFPQDIKESEDYLNSLGIQGIEVRQSQLNSLDVSGTPTIIVTNKNGEVSNFWVGKLPSEKEKEVFDKIKS